jgi:retron-type reverse transcriptase
MTNQIEATCLVINTSNAGALTIAAIYNPPACHLLDKDLDALLTSPGPTILCGDFNAKHAAWHSRRCNPSGKELHSYASRHQDVFVKGPTEPTLYHAASYLPDVIDIIVYKNLNLNIDLTTLKELSSDHNPVLIEIGAPTRPRTTTTKNTSWPIFTDAIQKLLPQVPKILDNDQLETAIDNLTSAISQAIDRATTHKTTTFANPTQLPLAVRELIREKNRARRRYQRSLDPRDKTIMTALQNDVKRAIREHRNSAWEDMLQSLDPQDRNYWRFIDRFKNRKDSTPSLPLHGRHGLVFSDEDKAEVLADSLASQCRTVQENTNDDLIRLVHREVRRTLADDPHTRLRHTNPGEVQQIIKQLKKRKAPGPDGIPNEALKSLPLKGICHLVAIINASLRLRHFPRKWKIADVVTIPKPGKDRLFPQNFRPISLLPTMGKVLEKIIDVRLKQEIQDKNVIPNTQAGFRALHSTTQQAMRVVELITQGFNHREATGAIFLDVSKAFDTVWHKGLLYKMTGHGLSLPLTQLISSFLRSRKFRIKHQTCRSTPRSIEAGVPQGSILAPTLFNIYVADMPTSPGTHLAQYADDTAIIARSRNSDQLGKKLQRAAETVERWFSDWRLAVNPDKSSAVLFQRRRLTKPDNIIMFDQDIPWTETAKYLGLLLDERLTWIPHTDQQTAKASAMISSLYPMFARNSRLSVDNKLLLYKTIIRPMMTYASPAWAYSGKTDKMQRLQNRVLRWAVNAPWYVRNRRIHEDLDTPTLTELTEKDARNFHASLTTHPNPVIAELWNYDTKDYRSHKRPKVVLDQQ